jgi:hypothetical protein
MDWHGRCWGILPVDPTVDLFGQSQFRPVFSFWERILKDEHLRDHDGLESCSRAARSSPRWTVGIFSQPSER